MLICMTSLSDHFASLVLHEISGVVVCLVQILPSFSFGLRVGRFTKIDIIILLKEDPEVAYTYSLRLNVEVYLFMTLLLRFPIIPNKSLIYKYIIHAHNTCHFSEISQL